MALLFFDLKFYGDCQISFFFCLSFSGKSFSVFRFGYSEEIHERNTIYDDIEQEHESEMDIDQMTPNDRDVNAHESTQSQRENDENEKTKMREQFIEKDQHSNEKKPLGSLKLFEVIDVTLFNDPCDGNEFMFVNGKMSENERKNVFQFQFVSEIFSFQPNESSKNILYLNSSFLFSFSFLFCFLLVLFSL